METYERLLIASALLLVGSTALSLWLVLKMHRQSQENSERLMDRLTSASQFQLETMSSAHLSSLTALSHSLESVSKESTSQQRLWSQQVDKVTGLLGTKDPISFQQVQAMTPDTGYDAPTDYDPSDEGELKRLAAREQGTTEALNGTDAEVIADLAGLDPFFG